MCDNHGTTIANAGQNGHWQEAPEVALARLVNVGLFPTPSVSSSVMRCFVINNWDQLKRLAHVIHQNELKRNPPTGAIRTFPGITGFWKKLP